MVLSLQRIGYIMSFSQPFESDLADRKIVFFFVLFKVGNKNDIPLIIFLFRFGGCAIKL